MIKDGGIIIHYPMSSHLSETYRDYVIRKGYFPIMKICARTVLPIPLNDETLDEVTLQKN